MNCDATLDTELDVSAWPSFISSSELRLLLLKPLALLSDAQLDTSGASLTDRRGLLLLLLDERVSLALLIGLTDLVSGDDDDDEAVLMPPAAIEVARERPSLPTANELQWLPDGRDWSLSLIWLLIA